jgi:membrane protein
VVTGRLEPRSAVPSAGYIRAVQQPDVVTERERHAPGGPESPSDVPMSRWRAIIKRTVAEIQRDRITLTAAGVAFYWFLSLFPMLFAAIAIMSLVQVTPAFQQQLSDGISTAVPGQAADVLQQALGASQARVVASLPAVLIALAFALWSASSGMAATQIGLNVAYDVEEDRTFVKRRLIGLVLLAIALVLGGVAIGLIVFGQQIGDAVADAFSARGVFDVVWGVVRWVVGLVAITTLFAIFYWIGPNRRPPSWRWLSPGGIVATVLWVLASVAFSLYVNHFGGNYAKTYGAIAGVVILLLWLYLTALAILIGAELNGELERQRARSATGEP